MSILLDGIPYPSLGVGRRHFYVAPEFLMDFMKYHDKSKRTYSIDRALPDDTRFIRAILTSCGDIVMIVESSEWIGESDIPLEPPIFTVYYLGGAFDANANADG